MVCNRCGTDNQPGVRFCVSCGSDLAEQPDYQQQQYQQAYYQQPTYQQQQYQQPYYQQPTYQQQYQQPYYQQPVVPADSGKSFAVASLILGIVSLLCFGTTGVLGIVLGVIAKSKGSKGAMATAGIVCGIASIIIWNVISVIIEMVA